MDQQTIDTYNKMAKEYDDGTVDFWERFPRTFLDKFIELSGKNILNVGSGPGRDGLLLKQAGKEVVCVDASEAMVKLSSERGLHLSLRDLIICRSKMSHLMMCGHTPLSFILPRNLSILLSKKSLAY